MQMRIEDILMLLNEAQKKSHRGNTVAKIWIEEAGVKKIDIAWSELSTSEEEAIMKKIDENWETISKHIDDVFAGKKVKLLKF